MPSSPAENDDEVELDFPGLFRLYKDGRFLRFSGTERLPPSLDPVTGVDSKDITVDPITGVSVRLYLPSLLTSQKLPVVVYIHGGAFCIENPASPICHGHLNTLCSLAHIIAVSVDYRLAPEHPLPAAYTDSWTALLWVFSKKDPWLIKHADMSRVFLAGDSAGGNICHNLGIRAGKSPEKVVVLRGIALIHPAFWGTSPVGSETTDPEFRAWMDKLWQFVCPETSGSDDPRRNPLVGGASNLALGCEKVLVTVAEEDKFTERGKAYYEKLKESGWGGEAELVEAKGVGHVFHLLDPFSEQAKVMIEHLVAFFNK